MKKTIKIIIAIVVIAVVIAVGFIGCSSRNDEYYIYDVYGYGTDAFLDVYDIYSGELIESTVYHFDSKEAVVAFIEEGLRMCYENDTVLFEL